MASESKVSELQWLKRVDNFAVLGNFEKSVWLDGSPSEQDDIYGDDRPKYS
jgi:hypothetical protein